MVTEAAALPAASATSSPTPLDGLLALVRMARTIAGGSQSSHRGQVGIVSTAMGRSQARKFVFG